MAKPLRYSEPVAVLSALAVLALWCRAFVAQQANYNYSDSFGPTLVALGQLTLVPDSAVTLFYNAAPTVLPLAIAAMCRLSGATPETVHAVISNLTLILGLGGLGYASARIARTYWAAAVAIIAVPFSWPFNLVVGYAGPFWTGVAVEGYWGVGWACAVWGLWIAGPATGAAAALPFVLTGLIILAHPTWGLILLSILGAGELLTVVATPERGRAARAAGIRVLVALVVGSPQFVLIASNLGQTVTAADAAGWWPLIQFRKSFHFYIWDGLLPYGRIAKLFMLTALSTAVIWPRLDRIVRLRAIATVITIAAITVFAYVVMEVLASRTLSALVLTRSLQLLAAACVVFVTAAAMSVRDRRGDWRGTLETIALWIAMIGLAVPVQMPYYSTAASGFSQLLPLEIGAIGNDSLSFLVTAAALSVALILRNPLRPDDAGSRPVLGLGPVVAASLVVWILTAAKLPMIPAFHGAAAPTATWTDLTTFIREKTPPDSLMVMPPYPYSIASARRSFLQDYSLLGAAVYNPAMTSFELGVLRNLYDVNLDGMSHEDITALLARNDGILCLLERRYRALLASEDKVRALKHAYPSAAFLVGFKPGVTPLEWVCGAHDAAVLPLPLAHENAEYVLYDLRTFQ